VYPGLAPWAYLHRASGACAAGCPHPGGLLKLPALRVVADYGFLLAERRNSLRLEWEDDRRFFLTDKRSKNTLRQGSFLASFRRDIPGVIAMTITVSMGVLEVVLLLTGNAAPQVDALMFEGKPSISAEFRGGYLIWREGRTWHVRWTTAGETRRFTGIVTAAGGELDSLKRIDVEKTRKLVRPDSGPMVVYGPTGRPRVIRGRPPVVDERVEDKIDKVDKRTIRFSSRTALDTDGFDFKVSDKAESLTFDLALGGRSRPTDIFIGANGVHPATNPVVVDLK
jgi:hypothetical protein